MSHATEIGVAGHQRGFALERQSGGKAVGVVELVSAFDFSGTARSLHVRGYDFDRQRLHGARCRQRSILTVRRSTVPYASP